MFSRLNTIKQKIIAVSMVSTSSAILLATLAFAYEYINTLHDDLERRIEIETAALAQNISASLVFDDTDAAREILSSFSVDEAVLAATVRDTDKQVFVEYYASKLGEEGRALGEQGIAFISRKIVLDKEELGEVTVLITHEQLNRKIQRVFGLAALIFALAVVTAFIISSRLQRAISQPILSLSNLANLIAAHSNYSSRVDIHSRDEIGELAKAFNHMLEQIEHRDSHLEKQVRQRTAELEKLAEEFRHRAFHDALTGLPNRAQLNERFSSFTSHARRTKTSVGLLLLDLDNFKTINDTLGHDFGDELLKLIAHRVQAVIRGEDIVSRVGGDEFVIMVQDIDSDQDLNAIADNVLEVLRDDIVLLNQRIKSSVSIGGALYPKDGGDLLTLKRNADLAMYSAKEAGKNQYRLFNQNMTDSSTQRLIVQNDLQTAIERGELEIYYQPKINLRTGLANGSEALIRWHHPQEGFLNPNEFIPFAEENGLILPMDHFVIRSVCYQIALWKQKGNTSLPVAINLSGLHFQSEEILRVLRGALKDSGIASHLLEVELTEAFLIEDPDRALSILKKIRRLGIKVNLDDFGTGYSSLSYLRSLPIDIVKLDKSFIDRICHDPQDKAITQGIITLARDLKLGIVAEGVELQEQIDLLTAMGCETVQGYFYKPPCPAPEFESWLETFNQQVVIDR
ncbi:EAL domain-containing protein [Pseudomaricurvus alkylphenolicus]|jgi:diguanylate cyclase (GGDEF)-like protein|uniref:putative bifunctional diguanylate cyclase/phosphodiesterase n=1 Tax=Pseudomaricurvus alkylphenolicus TaxID=1306991 RepID=UPI00141D9EE3|nr:EAL domain-containing protein [Pseudomaricurvus alkylphenolicus]NIB43033.1 EAL domain-containing protein [Pseudomaricurvus alkylphenolicus]